jgi:ATP-binding cassette, subfamily B, bacterial
MSATADRPEKKSERGGWKAWADRLQALRNLPPLLKLMWQASPSMVAMGTLSRILTGIVPLATLGIGRVIFNDIEALAKKHPLPSGFWWLVVFEFGFAAMGTVLGRVSDYSDTVLADRYQRFISVRVMRHASSLDLVRYEDPNFYDKLERARVQAIDRLATIRMLGQLLQQVITTITLIAGIVFFAPWLLLILLVSVLPTFGGETHFAFLHYALTFGQTTARRQLDYLRILGASKESAKELKLFGLAGFLTGQYEKISDQILEEDVQLARRKLWVTGVLSFFSTAGYYSTYAIVIYRTIIGIYNIGDLYFLVGAISGASVNLQTVFSTFSGIADQSVFLSDLLEFFKVKPVVQNKPNALPAPRPIRQGFEFRNVSFAYPDTTRLVLKNLNFRLETRERIALIGENGQGKTTIVKLITRLYDPTEGQILLDGVDLREYDLEDLSREIGVVFQDFMRYEMTASDNIATGKIEERDNDLKIAEAARKSGAHDLIQGLPGKYEQVLGRRFEGGVDLSGGQWQTIALSRAYLRDAQLLILDEPTASLDARAEHEVFERFADLTTGKMALLISHRFSTVRMADLIMVLENGNIIETGSHSELVAAGGRYSQMFELQASSYR